MRSVTVAEFPTTGGTDVEVVAVDGDIEFVVSNALTAESASPPRPSSTRCLRPRTRLMTRDVYESPAFVRLFQTYTGSRESIGAQLTAAAERARAGAPLIVATGSDLALYPGDGAPPTVDGFRAFDPRVQGADGGLPPRSRRRHPGPDEGDWTRTGRGRDGARTLLDSAREARAGELARAVGGPTSGCATFVGRE